MAPENAVAGRKRKCPESSLINYEVFLSFRGPDTRQGFTDFLYHSLEDAEIEVFRDDKGLRAGEEINPTLKEVIKRSKISIAVFSKDYASSKSCLMEVVQMWECTKSNGQTIIPIFYDICPSDVKEQTGDFATSFDRHEADVEVDPNTIKIWKEVLSEVGKLSGYERKNINGGYESQLVENVVRRVCQVLKKDDQVVPDKLVGIDLHVQKMMTKLGVVSNRGQAIRLCGEDVRVIGICGMPGIGKTTLAKIVFNKIHKLFDGCSFLNDINSRGLKNSQESLIANLKREKPKPLGSSDAGIRKIESLFTNMKVLIVLDDVHEEEQIKGLAEKVKWFGPGSRIIVTTHRKIVLKGFNFGEVEDRAAEEYEVKPMGDRDALQLFRKHAFRGDASQDVFNSLSIDIVKAIGGIPFAIVLTASYLSSIGYDKVIWKETLDSFKNNKQEKVNAAFKATYGNLDIDTEKIFLDIACFFIGEDERIPCYMWEACGYLPATRIQTLRDMHLLEHGENNEIRMHNLLRDFGRSQVDDKVHRECHKRCRFWNHNHALPTPEDVLGTGSVEGIGLTVGEGCPDSFNCEQFWKMSKLRYLRLDKAKIQGDIKKLPPELKWLDWRDCHSIPELGNMHLKELVILDLSRSLVPRDSEFWEQILKKVEKLEVLNLQGCDNLRPSLNFQAPINLEILVLEDCSRLSRIGPFISKLENLRSLNLRNCSKVTTLPKELYRMTSLTKLLIDGTGIQKIQCQEGSLKNLEILSARYCERLQDISTIGRLRKLSSLDLDGADIDGLPYTFEFPHSLRRLSLRECSKLVELPTSIGKLELLEVMDLSHTGIREMPESVKDLRNLKTLKMVRTFLRKFPKDVMNLENLEEIDFSFCGNLECDIRCYISGLSSLRFFRLSSSNVALLPRSIGRLCRSLQALDILDCNQLCELPKLPSSLLSLRWGSKIMKVTDLSHLTNLKELCLRDVDQLEAGLLNKETPKMEWITSLPSLEILELSLRNVTSLPGKFSALTQLRELSLSYMENLDLTQLPSSSSLWTLRLKHCTIQEPKFSDLKYLSELNLEYCNLAEIDGLECLTLLELLKISHCNGITNLNGLRDLPRLRKVEGIFSAQPILPKLSERVEEDICV